MQPTPPDGQSSCGASLDETVTRLADANDAIGLATLLAQRLGVETTHALKRLDASGEGPAALLCRAAGLSLNAYSAVLRMSRRRRNSPTKPTDALKAYRRLSFESARRVVTDVNARNAE